MEQTALQDFEQMTKKLIEMVNKKDDLSEISPEMIREIRECIQVLYH